MLETKVVEASESNYQDVINDYQLFGWNVLSCQKIDYTTTYTTGGGNAKQGYNYTVHNDRTAYYSITFQRDTEIKNYSELNRLFLKYLQLERSYNSVRGSKSKRFPVAAIILFVLGPAFGLGFLIGSFICFGLEAPVGGVICLLIAIIVTAITIILGVKDIKKSSRHNSVVNKEIADKRSHIFDQICEIKQEASELKP